VAAAARAPLLCLSRPPPPKKKKMGKAAGRASARGRPGTGDGRAGGRHSALGLAGSEQVSWTSLRRRARTKRRAVPHPQPRRSQWGGVQLRLLRQRRVWRWQPPGARKAQADVHLHHLLPTSPLYALPGCCMDGCWRLRRCRAAERHDAQARTWAGHDFCLARAAGCAGLLNCRGGGGGLSARPALLC
jgi:hypothetical protein